jgi:isoleucyl-tRNA synthetase
MRPTYYSPSSMTALAESELSYKDGYRSQSVYIGFPVQADDMSQQLREAYDEATKQVGEVPISLAVWTTTPWTLPANAVSTCQCHDKTLKWRL